MIGESILASAVVAALISVIGTIAMSIYLNRKNFKNDYYKIIIQKRIETYELLENQISSLKLSVLDTENKNPNPYHHIFSQGQSHLFVSTQNLLIANGKSLWLNRHTHDKLTEIINLINKIGIINSSDSELIEAGRNHYWEVVKLREELEVLIQKDILTLYDFNQMIKSKPSMTSQNIDL